MDKEQKSEKHKMSIRDIVVNILLAVAASLATATCVFKGTSGDYVLTDSCGSNTRDTTTTTTNAPVVVAEKQLNQIKFTEKVPMFHMVDTNGNFYLPLGSYSGATNTTVRYVALSRVIYPDTGTYVLAFSTNEFVYTESEGFKEVAAGN